MQVSVVNVSWFLLKIDIVALLDKLDLLILFFYK